MVTYAELWIYYIAGLVLLQNHLCKGLGGQLEGKLVPCDGEGNQVMVKIAADNPCIKCYCKLGIVTCEHKECSVVDGCHSIIKSAVSESCCPEVCQGCTYNNFTIKSGEIIQESLDPCVTLQCNAGVITRSTDVCFTPCKDPVKVPGKCCPVCQGCVYRGKTYANGLRFHDSKDPCIQCQCKDGNLECEKKACPQLNCPTKSLRPAAPGRCCPSCEGKRKVYLYILNNRCLFHPNNKVYSDGEFILEDNCQTCICQRRTVVCSKKTCPPLKCKIKERLPAGPGECCRRCPPPKKKCHIDGERYKHGKMWFKSQCTQCTCKDGVTHCWKKDCSSIISSCPKRTHELQYIGGSCCPQCIEISATCFVFGDPHYRTFDGLLYTFQGTCQYTLAQQCSGKRRTFSIQVRNAAGPDKTQYAYTSSVLITTTKYLQVELKQQLLVSVNGHNVTLPFIKLGHMSIIQRGYSLVVTTSLGVSLIWDGLSYLEVSMPQRYKDKMCGLCGNYNGISHDDLTGRHKTKYLNAIDFATSWQRGSSPTCTIASTPYNIIPMRSCLPTDTKTLRWIDKQCEILKAYIVTSECSTIGDIGIYYSECIDRLCSCSNPESCYCKSARSLLRACQPSDEHFDYPDITSICKQS